MELTVLWGIFMEIFSFFMRSYFKDSTILPE
jgi:hypothetical protein